MIEHYPLQFMFAFGIACSSAIGFAIAWYRSSRCLRELEDRLVHEVSPKRSEEPVADVLDGLAARVDEIANGQDFLNRILSERLARLPRARPSPEVTPV